jgi:hypothetical protein
MMNRPAFLSTRLLHAPVTAVWCVAILIAALSYPAHAQDRSTVILVSADTEGHIDPCSDCPDHQGFGGLLRRATLIQSVRAAHPDAILLDAGNFAFGSESLGSNGQVIVAAYDAMKYAAVNVSYRDFRQGKEQTLQLLKKGSFASVSTNLVDEATGKLLFQPYVVKSSGGKKIAIVGITALPPGIEALPHIRQELRGIKINPPAAALTDVLPKAKAESDAVILLFYGSQADAQAVAKQFGSQLAAIFVGGVRPEKLAGGSSSPPLIATDEHGKSLAQLTLGGEIKELAVAPSLGEDPAMKQVLARYVEPEAVIKPATGSPATAPLMAAAPTLPQQMELDRVYHLGLSAQNRGAHLTILNGCITSNYANIPAAAGKKLLVLASEWENIIPLTLIEQKQVPTAYKIPNLADHLYLVVDGSRLSRLHPSANQMAGHVPVNDFTLEQIGSIIRGNIVFEIPDSASSMELRFYDFAHGHMVLPLGPAVAPAKPLASPMENEVLSAAVYGVEKLTELKGHKLSAGMNFVRVDFRATSRFTTDADATAFDPKASKGQKLKLGTVADWTDAMKYATLVVDGQYGYIPIADAGTLGPAPRFLPDIPTGGYLTFMAPAECTSIELRCDFPNARTPDGKVIRPKGMTLPIQGTRPAPPEIKPLVTIDDDIFQVQIARQEAVGEFAGAAAGSGRKYIVLDVTVLNRNKDGEFFQATRQLRFANAAGNQLSMDRAGQAGLHPPTDLVWIPPGERRSFQAVYLVADKDLAKPRLAYRGISKAQVVELPAIQP